MGRPLAPKQARLPAGRRSGPVENRHPRRGPTRTCPPGRGWPMSRSSSTPTQSASSRGARPPRCARPWSSTSSSVAWLGPSAEAHRPHSLRIGRLAREWDEIASHFGEIIERGHDVRARTRWCEDLAEGVGRDGEDRYVLLGCGSGQFVNRLQHFSGKAA